MDSDEATSFAAAVQPGIKAAEERHKNDTACENGATAAVAVLHAYLHALANIQATRLRRWGKILTTFLGHLTMVASLSVVCNRRGNPEASPNCIPTLSRAIDCSHSPPKVALGPPF